MRISLFLISLFVALCGYSQNVNIDIFASGFNSPTAIEHAGDARLFVLERAGVIKILDENGTINTNPFLDISSVVSSGGERGLLGIAFHNEYVNT